MDKIEIREINGYRFAKAGHILLDTPPKGFAAEWYEAGREADTLLICSPDPFPESVRIFRQMRPKASIIAPYYTAWRLKEILGEDLNIQAVRCDLKLDGLKLSAVSQAGKGSFLAASDDNGVFWSGDAFTRKIEAVRYEKPTVVIACTTGCDFTGQMAEMIASGIRDSGMTDAVILDLCSEKTDDVIGACANAQGLLIGTSSSDGDAPECVWKLLTSMNRGIFSGKICGVFSSCGSDDSAAANVADRLRQLDMTFQEPAFSVQYVPDETAQNSIYEYGYDFGCRVQNVPNTHRSSLVKCLVCGEIFDASLGVCPVCGVGMDKCIPVEDEIIGHKEDTERTYLCVGGGIASLSAAEAIRKRDKTGKIIMLSAEDTPPVNRPMLTKNMAVSARVDGSIDVKEASWFSDNNIELRLNTRVCEIEPALKKVVLEDGTDISYDRLIYAAGAECFIPPIEGSDKKGVIAIRHLSDLKRVWELIPSAKSAVVIGGGALGLEAAAELKKMRLKVTVLELGARPMARQLDDGTADALIQAASDFGVEVYTGVNIVRISGSDRAESVELADGRAFPAGLVIISCGVRPNISAAQDAGARCARALVVNKYMETGVADLYAAGDCAEYEGTNYQLWAEATEQGRVAGANAAGDKVPFVPAVLGASFEGMNTALYAIGDVGKAGLSYQIVEYRSEPEKSFRKYWFAGGRLTGGVLFGDTEKIPMLNEAIEKHRTYRELKQEL